MWQLRLREVGGSTWRSLDSGDYIQGCRFMRGCYGLPLVLRRHLEEIQWVDVSGETDFNSV